MVSKSFLTWLRVSCSYLSLTSTALTKEVADFFNNIHPNEKGIRIGGLIGMPGKGKSMLAMAFCNYNLGNFYGKVCYLDFCEGNTLERKKLALQYLTPCRKSKLKSLTREHDANRSFNTLVAGQRILFVLDNITKDSMDEVREYLWAELGKNSCILFTAGSIDVLKRRNFIIQMQSWMRVPRLKEEEAIAIVLEMTCLEKSVMMAQHRDFALKCANICSFKEEDDSSPTFHPLALKTLGRHLFSKQGSDLSKWDAEIDDHADRAGDGLNSVFAVLNKVFDDMDPKHRIIFMLLTRDLEPKLSFNEVLEWLAGKCNEEIKYIEEAVENLCQSAFIEGIEPEIRIHDLFKEFAQIKAKQEDAPGKEKLKDDASTVQGGRMLQLQEFLKIEREVVKSHAAEKNEDSEDLAIVCKKKKHALKGGGRLKTILKLPKHFLNQFNRRKIIKKQKNYPWKTIKKPPKRKFRMKLFKHFWKGCGIGCAKLDRK
ncbi:hypothetical protein SUGI_0874310 [Cryptomeria japonica]|nr:hypothetical protein SUGI_0874310 [Cryptomeria japonica]